jgi:anti-sigma B factor antagonist
MLDTTIEQSQDGKATVDLSGSLTLGPALSALDSQLRELLDGGVRELTVNLAGVDFADSRGLGVLVQTHNHLKARGGTLRLTAVRPRVMELLRLTAVDTVIPIDAPPAELPPQE